MINHYCLECKQTFYSEFDDTGCPNCRKIRVKKQLEAVLLICSECNEIYEIDNKPYFCKEIHISEKIGSKFGCGKWNTIVNQEFWDILNEQITLKQVIDNILKS